MNEKVAEEHSSSPSLLFRSAAIAPLLSPVPHSFHLVLPSSFSFKVSRKSIETRGKWGSDIIHYPPHTPPPLPARPSTRSHLFVEQHSVEDGEGLHGVGQFAHHQVDADGVSGLEGEDDVEHGQGARRGLGLGHGLVLQALGLIARGVHPGHAVVGLGQDRLDLLVLVARQDGAEEVAAVHRSGENT